MYCNSIEVLGCRRSLSVFRFWQGPSPVESSKKKEAAPVRGTAPRLEVAQTPQYAMNFPIVFGSAHDGAKFD